MARSSHLGQVLLRERMPLPTLFLNPDDGHASNKENIKKKISLELPLTAARAVTMDGLSATIVRCVCMCLDLRVFPYWNRWPLYGLFSQFPPGLDELTVNSPF